jgi:hypothetical protein
MIGAPSAAYRSWISSAIAVPSTKLLQVRVQLLSPSRDIAFEISVRCK